VEGVERLTGAKVEATDLRGGAAMVLAALAAEGASEIRKIEHIERGYTDFVPILQSLGADITME
jgi:UDP-N-acetylglucosamine 1-carboxyvinyltransferase